MENISVNIFFLVFSRSEVLWLIKKAQHINYLLHTNKMWTENKITKFSHKTWFTKCSESRSACWRMCIRLFSLLKKKKRKKIPTFFLTLKKTFQFLTKITCRIFFLCGKQYVNHYLNVLPAETFFNHRNKVVQLLIKEFKCKYKPKYEKIFYCVAILERYLIILRKALHVSRNIIHTQL